MSKYEFILKLLDEGKDYAKILIPFLVGWHIPTPSYMKKKDPPDA